MFHLKFSSLNIPLVANTKFGQLQLKKVLHEDDGNEKWTEEIIDKPCFKLVQMTSLSLNVNWTHVYSAISSTVTHPH